MDCSNRSFSSSESFFLTIISLVAALGGFLFGYDTGIVSGALVFIRQTYSISTLLQEMIVSALVLGALIGAFFSGKLAHQFGSRKMLIYTSLTFIVGTLLSGLAANVYILIVARFLIGIAIGITSYVSPLFISEMAPPKNRGALVLLNGIMITGGEAIAFLVDYFLVTTHSWRIMFLTGLIPAILFFIGMLMLPSSPRWLILQGQIDKARDILSKTRSIAEANKELEEIIETIHIEKSHWSHLFSKLFQPVLIIGAGLGILQQFVGINAVMYYGPSIFQAAGFIEANSQILATFGLGLMNTIMTLIAILIVDKIGRRRMLLSGMLGAAVSLGMVGWFFSLHSSSPLLAWLTFFFMMLYIAGYSLSVGSLFWLIISEIYPIHIRSLAMSFATALQWGASFIVTLSFLSILNYFGAAFSFWMYGSMCIIGLIFCYYLVPETRGISLEHIEKNLRDGRPARELGEPIKVIT